MTRITLSVAVLAVVIGCKEGAEPAAKDSDESIVTDMTNILADAADIIEGIKTPADVQPATSRLASLEKKAENIRQLMTKRIKSKKAEDDFLEIVRLEKFRSRNKMSAERIQKALIEMNPDVRKTMDFESNKPIGGLVALLVLA